MIETKERQIGENTYMVTQLPARRALRLKTRLIKIFGPSLTQMLLTTSENQEILKTDAKGEDRFTSAVDEYKINEMQKASFVKAVQLLAESIDEKLFDDLLIELTQGVRRNGSELNSAVIDQSFAGNLSELYQLVYFVLEVNYSDFFALGNIGNLSSQLNPTPLTTKKSFTRA